MHNEFCRCGANQSCRRSALANGLGRSATCQSCYTTAINGCCPSEITAVQSCATSAGCTDQACLDAMCPTQVHAIDVCLLSAQVSGSSCQRLFRQCFGADYPAIDCGG